MTTREKIEVTELAYHRNGICGEPFYVAKVDNEGDQFLVVCFPPRGFPDKPLSKGFHNPRVAVFNLAKLGEGDIAFGSNSWRGEHYAEAMYEAIAKDAEA